VKTKDGNPAHCNKNNDVLMHFRALRAGCWSRRLSKLKNADMADHFAGRKTFYFTADGRSTCPEVLVNIDIDCHHSGSLDGALAFAQHLRASRFPNLYYEASTNGNGVHGYVVVVKGDLGDEGLNSALKRLDLWLKHELFKDKWDVENVEVKGNAPEFNWGHEKFDLRTYNSGQLAKLPREALSRTNELLGTTRIDANDLRRLKLPLDAGEPQEKDVCTLRPRESRIAFEKSVKELPGSISGRHFGHEELTRLQGDYLSLARELLSQTKLVAHGRKVVTDEDLAIFVMLLKFFTLNMNSDGSLPTARWRKMWTALFEAGDIERAWCHHRFAAIRNFLSGKDLLSWEDEGYVIGSEDRGRYLPGTASKWRASEELMTLLDGSQFLPGEKERGESILYGCNEVFVDSETSETIEFFTNFDSDVQEEEGESILYGCIIPFRNAFPQTTRQSPLAEPSFLARLMADIPPQRPQFTGYSWQRGELRMAA
jgi:hypothetical protein